MTAAADPGSQPPDVVVPVADLLARDVGPLTDLTVTILDAETYAWTGIDDGGRLISGKVSLAFAVADDSASFILRSTVVVEDEVA